MNVSHTPVVILEDVNHTYGRVQALTKVSLEIPAGRTVGLIGPDGVGKSTLMGLIAGSRRIQRGLVRVLGGDMADKQHRTATCPSIAYMPQGLGKNLYMELSVLENLDFFGRLFQQDATERRERIEALTRATGLYPFLDRPAGKLSGGMKQKVGLCSALIHDPELLILDEPTTGVDPLSRRQFWELIEKIRLGRSNMSVLVSTAYMEEAERFDWVVVMNAGQILTSGSPNSIRQQQGVGTLEEAFVSLLPPELRGHGRQRVVQPQALPHTSPSIVAEHLTRKFGPFTAVDDVSFSIYPGEIFGFLGSNGCGKTTTMKMLTGLIPVTEGKAWLFGAPVKGGDMDTRKRVGYMSQLFSLYGELTVEQNLSLHAHLFHLPAGTAKERISDLLQRFGLAPYLSQIAGKLPLGVRQRLSLAVALIHNPELLILDEPTSGVDPVARDEFWELLIQLSRRDKVTIFISTHFMNEAMRCDRISLMHAGKVLAQGAPADLIEGRKAASLEDAFISYMESATAEESDANGTNVKTSTVVLAPHPHGGPTAARHGFSLKRLLAYGRVEFLGLLRDPIRVAFAFLGIALLFVVFGFGVNSDVDHIRYAILDQDRTPESRAYVQAFSGTGKTFVEEGPLTTPLEMEARMRTQEIQVGLEIPNGFGRRMRRKSGAEVSSWIDGSNPLQTETLQNYVESAHQSALDRFGTESTGKQAKGGFSIIPRFTFNPTFESIYMMVPTMMGLLLMLVFSILMAVSVVREKELGSIMNFYVTSTRRIEFLLGKQLPYVVISMLNAGILVTMAITIFQVPLKGSWPAFLIAGLLYSLATTGFGLLVSSITSSQVAAVFGTAIAGMLFTVQFSGINQPVSTLQGSAHILGLLWPSSYFMQISVGVFTKSLGFRELLVPLVDLAIFPVVLTSLSVMALRKQER